MMVERAKGVKRAAAENDVGAPYRCCNESTAEGFARRGIGRILVLLSLIVPSSCSSGRQVIQGPGGASQAATVNISPGMDIPSVVNANPAGTTFVIYPGTYRLGARIGAKNGDVFIGQTSCAPPQTPCTAILNGSRLLTSFKTSGVYYYVTGQTQQGQVTITTAQCQNPYPGCLYPEDLYFDDKPLVHVTTLADVGPGKWFFDYPTYTIYFYDNPAGHKVETSVTPAAFDPGPANNVTIKGLTVEKFATPIIFGAVAGALGNASSTTGANWLIENNEIRLNHGEGIRINFGSRILNNYVHDNGNLGIGGGTSGIPLPSHVVIQGNELTDNNYAHVNSGFGAGGVKVGRTISIVIRGNHSHNNGGMGIHTDTENVNALIDGNTIADNTEEGAFHEISYAATFRNNKLLRNGYIHPNGTDWLYAANLLSATSQDSEAYCNTVEVSAQGGNGIDILTQNRGISHQGTAYISSNNYFHHNTVIFDGNSGVTGGANGDPNQPNFYSRNRFDYNTYHLPDLSRHAFAWNGSLGTFAQFQTAGQDTHGAADTNYTSSVPTVVITSPADESTVSGTVGVVGNAQDSTSISKVEFYVDWSLESIASDSHFDFTWSTSGVAAGEHILAAMAYNTQGIRACFSITLNTQQ
jgi:hypothetical protein